MSFHSWYLTLQTRLKYFRPAQAVWLWANTSVNFPTCLNIEVTNRCNLNCSFCPRDKMKRGVGDISVEIFERVLDQVWMASRSAGRPTRSTSTPLQRLLLYKDGESLLHPQFSQLVRLAKERGVARRIEIHTNAIPLRGDLSRQVLESGLDVLIFSVDAATSQEYQNLKGSDKFEVVVENIRNFQRLRDTQGRSFPQTVARCVRSKDPTLPRRFHQLFDGQVDIVEIAPLHHWDGSLGDLDGVPLSGTPYASGGRGRKRRYPCVIPWYNPVILWDGRLGACCVSYEDNELVMGDTAHETIEQIWQGEKYQALRKAHLSGDFTDWPTCRDCPHWQFHPGVIIALKNKLGIL